MELAAPRVLMATGEGAAGGFEFKRATASISAGAIVFAATGEAEGGCTELTSEGVCDPEVATGELDCDAAASSSDEALTAPSVATGKMEGGSGCVKLTSEGASMLCAPGVATGGFDCGAAASGSGGSLAVATGGNIVRSSECTPFDTTSPFHNVVS